MHEGMVDNRVCNYSYRLQLLESWTTFSMFQFVTAFHLMCINSLIITKLAQELLNAMNSTNLPVTGIFSIVCPCWVSNCLARIHESSSIELKQNSKILSKWSLAKEF